MLKILLFCVSVAFVANAAEINFDFIDARKKGYTDTEILNYVLQHFSDSDIPSMRQAGVSDREIVDYYIQKDSVHSQLQALATASRNMSRTKVSPEEMSARLALGCKIYTGAAKREDGWKYVADLLDFATAIYTAEYLKAADYFDISKSESVNLKSICSAWLDRLTTKDEISKLYALSLVNEIAKIVAQKKSLMLQ